MSSNPTIRKKFLCIALLIFTSSCGGVTFTPGLYPTSISGHVYPETVSKLGKLKDETLILLIAEIRGVIQFKTGSTNYESVHVYSSKNGFYKLNYPQNAISVELYFILPGYETELLRLSSSFGVGEFHYSKELEPNKDWVVSYKTNERLLIQSLLQEGNYRIAPDSKNRLLQWNRDIENRFNPNRTLNE